MKNNLEQYIVNNMRYVACSMVTRASSGHPGSALGSAPIIYKLFSETLSYDYDNPNFLNRDRFVLSSGHISSIYYTALHLFGYNVNMQDLMNFRQLGSITPGHPEVGVTPGVENSSGPLGQGVGNAVGMAIAQKHMASIFNKPNFKLFDSKIFCFLGEGCFMEGVSAEAFSIAQNYNLDNLVFILDINKVTIEGPADLSLNVDYKKYFNALNFNYLQVSDGNNLKLLSKALNRAKELKNAPTVVVVNTIIGYGSHVENSSKSHGTPFTEEELIKLKENLGVEEENFSFNPQVVDYCNKCAESKHRVALRYYEMLEKYKEIYSDDYALLKSYMNNSFLDKAIKAVSKIKIESKTSTRDMGYVVLNKIYENFPSLMGGSADVSTSTKAYVENAVDFKENSKGTRIRFGVREHGMAAVSNGIALFGGLKCFCSTFLSFSDYLKPALRMSALMELPIIYIFSHDNLSVGEDGASHQPVEQLVSLRSTPNVSVFRPFNFEEVQSAYICALKSEKTPTVIVQSKKKYIAPSSKIADASRGGYIFSDEKGDLAGVIISTGSEMLLALETQKILEKRKIYTRVVSMPCLDIFNKQPENYKSHVIPNICKKRIVIECASSYSWGRLIGENGLYICQNVFGASAKGDDLMEHFGFTSENISALAIKYLKK